MVSGVIDLTAIYYDGNPDDSDSVFWAVRAGTCAAGQGTVAGNVDGFSDSFSWDTMNFNSSIDASVWESGSYCFVFNPNGNSDDVRETVEFELKNTPTVKGECKNLGWQVFTQPEFKSQGDCVSFLVSANQAENNPDFGRGRGSRR